MGSSRQDIVQGVKWPIPTCFLMICDKTMHWNFFNWNLKQNIYTFQASLIRFHSAADVVGVKTLFYIYQDAANRNISIKKTRIRQTRLDTFWVYVGVSCFISVVPRFWYLLFVHRNEYYIIFKSGDHLFLFFYSLAQFVKPKTQVHFTDISFFIYISINLLLLSNSAVLYFTSI